eukprot:TRINITY_DN14764_c0_g1_i4.p1 TRINITY_DN14764_c0_g1~~TRINITY_DN14764_c0_g1_i4.p1  ORF type:complete len:232 (+),score=61.60 TRINITY_DN14764_c0_g1_i4:427-1122(+)
MIFAGGAALSYYRPILLGCALVLVISALKIFLGLEDDDDDDDLSDNIMVKMARAMVPSVTPEYHGADFMVYTHDGRKSTPLVVVLITIEFSDVVFAVDSVPAMFGVTDNSFIVWAACMCAILCLRSLYSMIVGAVNELEYMNYGIGLVLLFIAGKIVADIVFHVVFPVWITLLVVGVVLGLSAFLSVLKRNNTPKEDHGLGLIADVEDPSSCPTDTPVEESYLLSSSNRPL